jgi:predicted  nucleic acid-binding Zn-ribbon protein
MSNDNTNNETLNEVLRIVSLIETGVGNLSTRVEAVEENLEGLNQQVVSVQTRFVNLEAFDERLLEETRPFQQSINQQLTDMRSEMDKGFRQINRQFDHLAGEMVRLHARNADLEERVGRVEEKAS